MFLVASLDSLIKKRIQNNQECHVNYKHRYDPYDDDNDNLDDAGVAVFILANTSRTKLLLVSNYLLINFGQNHSVAIATKDKTQLLSTPNSVCAFYHFSLGTLAMQKIRSLCWVEFVRFLLFTTEEMLGQMHLQRLFSQDCACNENAHNNPVTTCWWAKIYTTYKRGECRTSNQKKKNYLWSFNLKSTKWNSC